MKLKVHDSIFVPLAKWPMLIAGNYRCIRPDDMIPIKEAVHGDVGESRGDLRLGVGRCAPARRRTPPTWCRSRSTPRPPRASASPLPRRARCSAGAEHIERVDCLVRRIARQHGLQSDTLDEIVELVDERLGKNRQLARRNAA